MTPMTQTTFRAQLWQLESRVFAGLGFCFVLPFPIERRLSSFGLTEVKRKQYLCSNSTRLGEPLRNSFLVLRQILVNLLIRGRVSIAFARRKNSRCDVPPSPLGRENTVPNRMGVLSQTVICMSEVNSFQRLKLLF